MTNARKERYVLLIRQRELPETHSTAGQRRSSSIYPIRGYRNPSTFLLHGVRKTIQERCSV